MWYISLLLAAGSIFKKKSDMEVARGPVSDVP
jgi:hypothetical protein